MIEPEPGRGECRGKLGALRRRSAASVTAVGRPLATSSAKLGPESTAGGCAGRTSAITSLRKSPVARSMPLAQTPAAHRRAIMRPARGRCLAHRLRRHGEKDRFGIRDISERGGRHEIGRKRHAGQASCIDAGRRHLDRMARRRAPKDEPWPRCARRDWRAPCPRPRRRARRYGFYAPSYSASRLAVMAGISASHRAASAAARRNPCRR